MELQQAWYASNFYLKDILAHTKDLRQKMATDTEKFFENKESETFVLGEIDEAMREIAEAFRLSTMAKARILNLYSKKSKSV